SGTPTRKHLDALGRLRQVEQNLAGRLIATRYEYDTRGNTVSHTDPLVNTVRIRYDLLGRTIQSDRPERRTVMIFDVSGNLAEGRTADGPVFLRECDECKRLTSVRLGPALPPVIQYTYH